MRLTYGAKPNRQLLMQFGFVLPDPLPMRREVLGDDVVIADVMGPRFEGKWLMQLSLFPKKANEATGAAESTFEEVEEWIPPPPTEGEAGLKRRLLASARCPSTTNT